jgi:iron complex transport system substrate-binding protein
MVCLLIFLVGPARAGDRMTVTDMGGRTVSVPRSAVKVYSRSPVGTLMMYSLNSVKIAGQNWQPTDNEKLYLKREFLELPVLSGWFGDGNVGNTEEIVKAAPDLILSAFYGKASPGVLDQADRIQQQLNVPVVLVNASLESLDASYRFVGGLIGERERAELLADYAATTLADIKTRAATIKPAARRRIYYAEGPNGLQTDPLGSRHARVIELVNGVNVATVKAKSGMGRTVISPEQLLQWNPDVILACHDQGFSVESSTFDAIRDDARLASLKAVKSGQVYRVPYKPFNFVDRPPSINRLIGLKWLGHLLYPATFDYDVRAEAVRFYKLFYDIDLSKEQLDDLFSHSE